MAQETQRVKLLKTGFMDYFHQGKSIKEIAIIFSVTPRTVYNNLKEIADANGVDREFLLERVHSPHCSPQKAEKEVVISFEEVNNLISNLQKEIQENIITINKAL